MSATRPMTVYALIDPRSCAVRYVGITNNPTSRYRAHLSDQRAVRRGPLGLWLSEMRAAGVVPAMRRLASVSFSRARDAEARWMRRHRGMLVNCGPAGAGLKSVPGLPYSFAFRCSDEDRANIRKLAEHEERTEGDTVRVVLRRAAEALS